MTIYYINAVLSSWLLYYAEKRINNKVAKLAVLAGAIAVPCILAALRARNVGTDTSLYGMDIYFYARTNSLTNYLTINPSFSITFNLLSWLVAILSPSLTIFLFLVQLGSSVPVVIALRMTSKKDAYLGYLMYLIIIYPMTFNIIRQAISQGSLVLSAALLFKKQYKKCILTYIIAVLIHHTALLGIVALITVVVSNNERKRLRNLWLGIMYGMTTSVLLLYPKLSSIIAALSGEYAKYLNDGTSEMFGSALFVSISLSSYLSVAIIAFRLKRIVANNRLDPLINICAVGSLSYSWAVHITALYRPSLYLISFFPMLAVESMSHICHPTEKHLSAFDRALISNRIRFILFTFFFCICFAQVYYGILGLHQICPYILR